MSEPLADALAEAVIAELAERHSKKLKQNPAWNRKDERAAWAADQEYEVPEYIERPMAERLRDVCMITDHHEDGELFIRALSYAEVGEVVRAVAEAEVERLRGELARRDEQITAVRALLVPVPMEACDRDCGWCGDTCDRVAEMREYVYVEQIRAALDGTS